MVVEYLMSQARVSNMAFQDYSGCSLLHYATASGHVRLIYFLIYHKGFDQRAPNDQGRMLLHYATMKGNIDAVKRLFDIGAVQPNSLYKNGQTPF